MSPEKSSLLEELYNMNDKLVIAGLFVNVEILPSATRHGLTKEDILYALERSIYDETLETDPNKTLSIGYDRNARLL